MIDGRNLFHQPTRNNIKTYENRKIATGQEYDHTTGCLLDNLYFKENYILIAIVLSKQQALDVDTKAKNRLILLEIWDQAGNTTMFFILEEVKKNFFGFFTRNSKIILNVFHKFILL